MGNVKNPITTDKALMGESTNEIIKVNYETEQPTVSARDLYDSLSGEDGTKGTERFSKWFERYCGYGFVEGEDYSNPYQKLRVQIEGNREVQREVEDYDLSIDMAKQICMLQKTERGKKIRQYLIDLDKAWNTPEQVMARALEIAHKTIDKMKSQNALLIADNQRMKPKEEFFDAVADSKDAIEIGKVAKVLNYPGIGRNKLFEILRDKGILMKDNKPYQKYIDNGFFRTIEQKYQMPDGETRISIKTLVYQKGVDYIRKVIEVA